MVLLLPFSDGLVVRSSFCLCWMLLELCDEAKWDYRTNSVFKKYIITQIFHFPLSSLISYNLQVKPLFKDIYLFKRHAVTEMRRIKTLHLLIHSEMATTPRARQEGRQERGNSTRSPTWVVEMPLTSWLY